MKRRDVFKGAAAVAAGAAAGSAGMLRPALAQNSKVLVFAPEADLANPDPIWTTATIAQIHGYLVWDTL